MATVDEAVENSCDVPKELSADADHPSARAVEDSFTLGVQTLMASDRSRHGANPELALLGRISKRLSAKDRIRGKLRTKSGWERNEM